MASDSEGSYPVIKSIKVHDRQYDLLKTFCSSCNKEHFEVLRFCGPTFARYWFPSDLTEDNFAEFVEVIDEKLLETSADMLNYFYGELEKVNSPTGIEANFSMEFRLLEYGRQRASELGKMNVMDALLSREPPATDMEKALRLAFEFGAAVAEHMTMTCYEDYMWDGIAMSEWRESGLPTAREERLRQGVKTRNAIAAAAKALFKQSPELIRNDSETARAILKMRLPELQKSNGTQLTVDAVTRHLRALRKGHLAALAETAV
ncbi:hypothetical protein G5V57_18015 [Nordella sp. HKS 07]|uniref:hypothetical protein n=1 Tax=Nordella sp. HKS 07 TaxID=2712222 RepID=UPI0013E15EC7|nr:hypothetical protein [Nordella sp. HKS 07]QIG49445.1 hypothetical protein G5V57_18015 [Nordella sp. HKS 07]